MVNGISVTQLDLSGPPKRYIARHMLPLTIPCPACKSPIGAYCKSRNGNHTKAHAPRCTMVFEMTDEEAIAALDGLAAEKQTRCQNAGR